MFVELGELKKASSSYKPCWERIFGDERAW